MGTKLGFVLSILLVTSACGPAKLPQVGLDYGPEEGGALEAKDDSATRPASLVSMTIGQAKRATFTATRRWRAFLFSGRAGQRIDVYLDGRYGLDTVVYLYKVSRTTSRPYGRPLASNDDTDASGWTINEYSSSIQGFALWEDRAYAVVATTYEQAGIGSADLSLRESGATGSGSERIREAFLSGVGDIARYREDPRFLSSCASLPAGAHSRCEDMQYGSDALRVWRFAVDARTVYALLADHEREGLFVDLLDGTGRWIDHGFLGFEPGATPSWGWSDDNDPTICKCESDSMSAICRGPDGGSYFSGSIPCE